ncbi:hypothetical protein ACU19_07100 [Actinobaculum suis]|uniref:hypothetical protein n=1 Tax=Actinobaculum suis TaxID=1657 RepID=UPI00066FD68B|nr:hypothetical protein [Actinobaculum suis]KMY22917.1 hypothetical protein ACU19_07100 [Actinobaculum suis]
MMKIIRFILSMAFAIVLGYVSLKVARPGVPYFDTAMLFTSLLGGINLYWCGELIIRNRASRRHQNQEAANTA